jgi:hypothetical protein
MSTDSNNNIGDQEIDLATISKSISKAFQNLNRFIFNCIQFMLRNIIIVVILFIIGAGLGFYLDKIQKVYDHRIIVTPNFGSTDYLYSKIELINSKIKENDTIFLKSIGIQKPSQIGEIKVKPIIDIYRFVSANEQNYKLLELMANDNDINKIVEENTTSKNYTFHVISFSTRKKTTDAETVQPILNYLNSNKYFRQVQKEFVNNIRIKMKANEVTIAQIDGILNEFARTAAAGSGSKGDNLVYINENTQMNDVIKTKDELVKEQGDHRLDLVNLDKIIKENSSTINIQNKKSTNGKLNLILPFLFVFIFISIFLFRAFYRKQAEKYKI